ncbi:hypothetical protein ES703_75104 [subsurface metagenome]
MTSTNMKWLEIAERGFVERFQIGYIIMLYEYESPVLVSKNCSSAGLLSYVPEVGIIQP